MSILHTSNIDEDSNSQNGPLVKSLEKEEQVTPSSRDKSRIMMRLEIPISPCVVNLYPADIDGTAINATDFKTCVQTMIQSAPKRPF